MNLAQRISNFFNLLGQSPQLLIAMIVSVIVFAVLYFYLIRFYQNHDAGILIILFTFVMIISAAIITMADEQMNTAIFLIIPAIFVVLTAVLYSVEIKRLILAKSSSKL